MLHMLKVFTPNGNFLIRIQKAQMQFSLPSQNAVLKFSYEKFNEQKKDFLMDKRVFCCRKSSEFLLQAGAESLFIFILSRWTFLFMRKEFFGYEISIWIVTLLVSYFLYPKLLILNNLLNIFWTFTSKKVI